MPVTSFIYRTGCDYTRWGIEWLVTRILKFGGYSISWHRILK